MRQSFSLWKMFDYRLNHLTICTSIQMFCVLGSCLVSLCFQSLSISSRLSNLLMYKCL